MTRELIRKQKYSFVLLIVILCTMSMGEAQGPNYSLDYDNYIIFHWKGALTSHSIVLKIFPRLPELNDANYNTYVIVQSQTNDVQNTNVILADFAGDTHPVAKITIDSLNPSTSYSYGFLFTKKDVTFTNEDLINTYISESHQEFSFTTLGIALLASNFSFGAASCASTGSNSTIFNSLHNENFHFFIHMGDLHYSNIGENDTEKFYQAYFNVFSSSTQKLFFENTPIFYVWDDHDFGVGNSDGNSPSRYAANYAYRDFVPYGALKNHLPSDDASIFPGSAPASNTDESLYAAIDTSDNKYGIFQSFIVGRCLFIILDLRTFKDVITGDILGEEQMGWLENQFKFAGNNPEVAHIFIVSSFPWIHAAKESEWSDYPQTQTKIANWVNEHVYKHNKTIMMLSGDAHMLAFDDGSNNEYGAFPIVQAAALDRYGSCKGGPYSHGLFPGGKQYGVLNIVDDGSDKICVQINLKNPDESLILYDTCHPEKYPRKESACPLPVPENPEKDTVVSQKKESWPWILLGIAVLGILGYVGWMRYKKHKNVPEPEADNERGDYIEMSEPKRKPNNP